MSTHHSNDFYRGERVALSSPERPGTITNIRNNNSGTTYTVRMDDGTTIKCGPYALHRI